MEQDRLEERAKYSGLEVGRGTSVDKLVDPTNNAHYQVTTRGPRHIRVWNPFTERSAGDLNVPCSGASSEALCDLFCGGGLRRVNVSGCSGFDDRALEALCTHNPGLQVLWMDGTLVTLCKPVVWPKKLSHLSAIGTPLDLNRLPWGLSFTCLNEMHLTAEPGQLCEKQSAALVYLLSPIGWQPGQSPRNVKTHRHVASELGQTYCTFSRQ